AENRLTVLLGIPSGSLEDELARARPVPVPPDTVGIGVPTHLLRRRPDVRAAERVLAAETARIGVATADLFPRLTLLGRIGLQAEAVDDLADSDSTVFGFGPSLRWTLFDGGRRRARIEAQDARAEQALVRWERTVLLALEEAENAMTSFVRERDRHASLESAVEDARRASELARTEYGEGLVDFQAVVDSERTLAALEDELAASAERITTEAIALYKALGGDPLVAPAAAP